MRPQTRRDIGWIAVLWVILSLLGELGVRVAIAHYPVLASAQARITGGAVFFLLRVTVPLFILITLVLVYSAVRHRASPADTADSPVQYRYGRVYAWSWAAISVSLNVLFIIHPGITGLQALGRQAAAASDPLEVDVTAQQWEWTFAYPSLGLENQKTLVVPVDQTIRFVLRSKDVIHSFWVPAWGMKMAVIPGEARSLFITPDKLTSTLDNPMVRVQCAQICGVGHAQMRTTVKVVSAEAFAKWAKGQRGGGMKMKGMSMGAMQGGKDEKKGGAPVDAGLSMGTNTGGGMQDIQKSNNRGQSQ